MSKTANTLVVATALAGASLAASVEVTQAAPLVAPDVSAASSVAPVSYSASQMMMSRYGRGRLNGGYFMQDLGPSWVNSPRGIPMNGRIYQRSEAAPSVLDAFAAATGNRII